MFAVALVPASGLTVIHSHDYDHPDHDTALFSWSGATHVRGVHHDEGLHAHRVGWNQVQKASVQREIGAPVLVAQIWLNVLASVVPVERSPGLLRLSAESELVHAPPPLLRSMAFLI